MHMIGVVEKFSEISIPNRKVEIQKTTIIEGQLADL